VTHEKAHPAPLVLTSEQRTLIEREGCRAYPSECCGVLLGRDEPSARRVVEVRPLANDFEADQRHRRFSITPQALLEAERESADQGLLVLGFYHSHPDHPARPSEFDREHAWPFYSYVIVSVEGGRAGEMTSWVLDEACERFGPQPIESR